MEKSSLSCFAFSAPSAPNETSSLFAPPRFRVSKRTLLQQRARPFLVPVKVSPNKRKRERSAVHSLVNNPFTLVPASKRQLLAVDESRASHGASQLDSTTQITALPSSSLQLSVLDPRVAEYLSPIVKDPNSRLSLQLQSSSSRRHYLWARRRHLLAPIQQTRVENTSAQRENSNLSSCSTDQQSQISLLKESIKETCQNFKNVCIQTKTPEAEQAITSLFRLQYRLLPLESSPFYRPSNDTPQHLRSGICYAMRDPRRSSDILCS